MSVCMYAVRGDNGRKKERRKETRSKLRAYQLIDEIVQLPLFSFQHEVSFIPLDLTLFDQFALQKLWMLIYGFNSLFVQVQNGRADKEEQREGERITLIVAQEEAD